MARCSSGRALEETEETKEFLIVYGKTGGSIPKQDEGLVGMRYTGRGSTMARHTRTASLGACGPYVLQ